MSFLDFYVEFSNTINHLCSLPRAQLKKTLFIELLDEDFNHSLGSTKKLINEDGTKSEILTGPLNHLLM